jgi:DNA primase
MTLPPGFLDELRSRLSLADIVGRKVAWDLRRSNQARGDFWAPCPFHEERTASFHVDDRKGCYYCFGCHAKGDAISFVRETENLGFLEAVERLAREAGMALPERDPAAQAAADRRGRLLEAMEAAARHYRLQLSTAAAGPARDYLARRGLGPGALERFGIGYAPDDRDGLLRSLTAKGFDADLLVEAGLVARPEDGGAPYDRFRGRIMFPIRDGTGRAIAFGGRALDPAARAKYLNSPETPLFDKGRTLYNLKGAREAAGRGQPLIVAEGYMDVIALVTAGFEGACAPLGTAITAEQLALLWRMHPEPVVALDGDRAGLAAAMRLVDLALPMVSAGQALRFCLLPEGQDPDDVIRSGGAGAMRALLDRSLPMVALIWRRETEGRVFDSPERRAALDRRLRAALGRIADAGLRAHYAEELRRLRADLFGTAPAALRGRARGGRGGSAAARSGAAAVLPATRASLLAQAGDQRVEEVLREAVILATLIAHPSLLPEFAASLEGLDCIAPDHAALRGVLLDCAAARTEPAAAARAAFGPEVLERLRAQAHLRIAPPLRPGADVEAARMCLAEAFARLAALRGCRREIAEAADDLMGLADEGVTWRLRQAAEAAAEAALRLTEDRTAYEVAPNGARLSRAEIERFRATLSSVGEAGRRLGGAFTESG